MASHVVLEGLEFGADTLFGEEIKNGSVDTDHLVEGEWADCVWWKYSWRKDDWAWGQGNW